MQGSALKRLHFIIKLSKLVVAIGRDENCFHNCVSPFSSGVNKRISVPIMKTGLNIVNKTHINSTILGTFANIQLACQW